MKIKVFQALYGDAICINYKGCDNNYHNIYVDSGFAGTYARTIKAETLDIIKREQLINAFIITHIDRDHIFGSLCFIKEFGNTDIVNEFWFNTYQIKIKKNFDSGLISYTEGIKLRDYLNENGKIVKTICNNTYPINFFGATFTFLSPVSGDLYDFEEKWYRKERGLISAQENDYKYSIEELAQRKFFEDTRLENKVSISFIFEHNFKKILFLSDSHPTTIIDSLKNMGYSKDNKIKMNYIKLSHHGSKGNTSYKLLELIECENFIITANGYNRDCFPHKESLARIIHHNKQDNREVNLIFNYDNDVLRNIFNKNDKKQYNNFKCHYPEEKSNAFIIEL